MSDSDIADPARRRFLHLMGASMALASGACSGPPPEAIVPYVDLPPELADAAPLFYASAFLADGYAEGVLVESNQGRATKVEGNDAHPASLGATSVHAQASILQLWDPERSQAVYARGALSTWAAFDAALDERLTILEKSRGEGLRILTAPLTSPTLLAQIDEVLARYPQARWHVHEPLARPGALEGAKLAFGRPLEAVYRFDAARVIVALDADFLGSGPGAVRYARDFARRRTPRVAEGMSRLYALECTPGLVGAMADERLALAPQRIERALWRVASGLGLAPAGSFPDDPASARWERAVAAALSGHRGEALVVAGANLTPQTHALAARVNAALGAVGRTLVHVEPVARRGLPLDALVSDTREGRVDTLLMLGVNPAYEAAADLEFAAALKRVALSIHAGLYRDETARLSAWHVPQPHIYEQWSDARAFDGTATILQPSMRARFAARSSHELLAKLAGVAETPLQRVRRTWRPQGAQNDAFDAAWRESLRRGVVEGTAATAVNVGEPRTIAPPSLDDAPLVAVMTHDEAIRGSDWANNAWLHELPRPLTKLVWDNAVLIAPATAAALGIASRDVVRVKTTRSSIEAPVWVAPAHAENAITLPLGYGRWAAGSVGNEIGFDANRLRIAASGSRPVGVTLEKTGRRHDFVTPQNHASMEGRDIVRHATLAEFTRNPAFANDERREKVPDVTLYPPHAYPDYAWGMSIDLNACIGCGACTIACQAENNIPVVGKEEVARGREMHWIRVDRYYEGPLERPRTYFQPVPCMHCENAPCEEVCPVGATLHDSEGLNLQVYNRCVGTRFCSQNCPYKVRRFNFLKYSTEDNPGLKALHNPEVTVRGRGVMEKCTYCVQRITRGRIEAEKLGRKLRDGEVVTACQAVCPTRAIVFGDLNDPASAVKRAKSSPLDYTLLAELNTRPRTTYLARIANPDPEGEA